MTTNIYRIKAFNSIMCGYFCIGFSDFMCLLDYYSLILEDYIYLFSPDEYENNDKTILKYFQ